MKLDIKTASVIVTGVGGIVGQGIIKSLKYNNTLKHRRVNYKIIGLDASPMSVGLYCVDKGLLLPRSTDADYIQSLISISRKHSIDAIYVSTDPELDVVHKNKRLIEMETNSKVLINQPEVVRIARDKWNTYQFLKQSGFPTPKTVLPKDVNDLIEEYGFPLVVKPREGFGSKLFHVVHDLTQLEVAIAEIQKAGWKPIIQEFIEGDESGSEYSTGIVLSNKGKNIISSITIKKLSKFGQTYKAFIEDNSDVRMLSERVSSTIGSIGAINIQTKSHNDGHKILEINARFSASCPMRTIAGVNEPDLVYRDNVLNDEIRVTEYKKIVCMRFFDEMYIDYLTLNKISKHKYIEGVQPNFPNNLGL
jgi:carbamoyl-phosphate synthase large subunit